MKFEFTCDFFDDLIFIIESKEFRYKECEILAERESKAISVIDLVLKSPTGDYTEIIVRSSNSATGKDNFKNGYYVGQLVSPEYALDSADLINILQ